MLAKWELSKTGPINRNGKQGSAHIDFGVISIRVFTDKGLTGFTWQVVSGGVLSGGSKPTLAEACNESLACFDTMLAELNEFRALEEGAK